MYIFYLADKLQRTHNGFYKQILRAMYVKGYLPYFSSQNNTGKNDDENPKNAQNESHFYYFLFSVQNPEINCLYLTKLYRAVEL